MLQVNLKIKKVSPKMSLFIIYLYKAEKIPVCSYWYEHTNMFIWGVEVTDGNYEKAKTFSFMFYDTTISDINSGTTISTFEDLGFNRDDRFINK